jgi:hypothetical protein
MPTVFNRISVTSNQPNSRIQPYYYVCSIAALHDAPSSRRLFGINAHIRKPLTAGHAHTLYASPKDLGSNRGSWLVCLGARRVQGKGGTDALPARSRGTGYRLCTAARHNQRR